MEFNSKKLNIKVDGIAYELSYPTVKQVKEIDKKLDIDGVCSFVSTCGLPIEVVENLQADHLNKLVEVLVGKKKES